MRPVDRAPKDVHVLHVVPGLGPGGMELTMGRVITSLAQAGIRHSIACLKGEADIADRLPASTDIHCFHSRPNEPQLPLRIARLIRTVRPTVIHARNWGAWPDSAAGRLLARPIVPLVFSFHGLGRAGYMPLRRRVASWFLSRMTTYLFTVSEQSKRMLVDKWGWPADRTNVIPNGVDIQRFCPSGNSNPRKQLIVGTVGNLRPVKNHAILVRACADLVRRGMDLQLHIAGEGALRSDLTALAESLGIGGRFQLVGLIEDVPKFLHGLDVFVLSSDSEQHPNALNEAMACGLSCVATEVGCVEELLDSGRCGRIVSPGDTAGLTAALADLLADRKQRERLGASARQRACDHYSSQRMVTAYEEMYRRLSLRTTKQP